MQEVEVIVHKWSDLAKLKDPDARIVADETIKFSWMDGPVQELDVTAGEFAEISKFFIRLEDAARAARKAVPATDSLTDKRAYRKALLEYAKEHDDGSTFTGAGKNLRVVRDVERKFQATLRPEQIPPKYRL